MKLIGWQKSWPAVDTMITASWCFLASCLSPLGKKGSKHRWLAPPIWAILPMPAFSWFSYWLPTLCLFFPYMPVHAVHGCRGGLLGVWQGLGDPLAKDHRGSVNPKCHPGWPHLPNHSSPPRSLQMACSSFKVSAGEKMGLLEVLDIQKWACLWPQEGLQALGKAVFALLGAWGKPLDPGEGEKQASWNFWKFRNGPVSGS